MAERPPERPKRPGFVGRVFHFVFGTLAWLFVGWVFSIGAEWLGMWLWWPHYQEAYGVLHARAMVTNELGYLTAFGADASRFAAEWAERLYGWLFIWQGTDVALWLLGKVGGGWFADLFLSAVYVTQTYGVRIAVALLSMPAFALLGFVGFVEGLCERDLRKWGGGTESAFVFHRVLPLLPFSIAASWVVYLGLPISLHPNWVFLPAALTLWFGLFWTATTFKKHL